MPAPYVEYPIFHFVVFHSFKNHMFVGVWIDIRVLNLFPLVFLYVFMPISGCFHYCTTLVEFEVSVYDVSRSSIIVQDCFGYLAFFSFLLYHMKLSFALLRSVKNFAGLLMGLV